MINDAAANLRGRSEFVAEHGIADHIQSERQRLEGIAARNREALALDALWEASDLKLLVQDAAEKLGSTYVYSTTIGPTPGLLLPEPKLPLRLGARVREVFIVGNDGGLVEATRGQLIMHRVEKSGKHHERGFFVLLTKLRDRDVPLLTFGRTDASLEQDDAYTQLCIEALLGSDQRERHELRPCDAEAVRTELAHFDPIADLNNLEAYARHQANPPARPWQQVFKETVAIRSSAYRELDVLDALFAQEIKKRALRADITHIGLLRQNQASYIHGQDASLVVTELQNFFDQVHEPMQTRPDQKLAALQDLEDGSMLEKIDPNQVTEIDVAKTVIRNWNRTVTRRATRLLPIPVGDLKSVYRTRIELHYGKYPELKAYIDTFVQAAYMLELERIYPGVRESLESGDDNQRQVFLEQNPGLRDYLLLQTFHRGDFYRGKNPFLNGMSGRDFNTLIKGIAAHRVEPVAQAFPYD